VGSERPIVCVIPAVDEEMHIGRCVRSVSELGPVYVIDGGSTDRTAVEARLAGATVVDHKWTGYSAQKNWALENVGTEHEWVFLLDADEYLPPKSAAEIRHVAAHGAANAYSIARQNIVLGRKLRYAWWYPDWQVRLMRRGTARFEDRLVHEHVIVAGATGYLSEPLIHENLKGVNAWMHRHIRYAALEAAEIRKARDGNTVGGVPARFLGTRAERRRALKTRVWYRLPMRPAIRFFWMYVLKRGMLDGRAGLLYCQLMAAYESLVDANVYEQDLEPPRGP
jgi:glycosyltransferase involved in cell wall biosynthesis